MARYIDTELLMRKIIDKANEIGYTNDGKTLLYESEIIACVDSTPTADEKEVVKGEWIENTDALCYSVNCSACGKLARDKNKGDFCLHCGADMRGAEK